MLRAIAWLLIVAGPFWATAAAAEETALSPSVVIIIDDMGDNLERGEDALALPGPITYSMLPHSPYGARFAREARAAGKDVLLHAPMENTHDRPLGPGALTADLERDRFLAVLRDDLESVPFVQGLNNHMGSQLTTLEPQMGWVMDELRRRGLFFIDSMTTTGSVAARVAGRHGVPALRRDVFLDHERTPEFVHTQFRRLLRLARERGSAVAIGHPHEVTVRYLREALPLMDEMGIRLVSASALLLEQQELARLTRHQP